MKLKKKTEEDHFMEKKQLEKELHAKELMIYDMQVLITEKEEKIAQKGTFCFVLFMTN